jgi:hypothetical protein
MQRERRQNVSRRVGKALGAVLLLLALALLCALPTPHTRLVSLRSSVVYDTPRGPAHGSPAWLHHRSQEDEYDHGLPPAPSGDGEDGQTVGPQRTPNDPGLLVIYEQEPNSPKPQPAALIHCVTAAQLPTPS